MIKKFRVLVVDDSPVFCKLIQEALLQLPGIEVVGVASNGKIALQLIEKLQPDLVTLDIEMPVMTGTDVLRELKKCKSPPTVIVVSSINRQSCDLTMRALLNGAFDFITKPQIKGTQETIDAIKIEIYPRIHALRQREDAKNEILVKKSVITEKSVSKPLHQKPSMILIGVSTGGPNTLSTLFSMLPYDLGIPILVVQHMPPLFTKSLAEQLNEKSRIVIVEAENGQVLKYNNIYLAPGGKQMKLVKNSSNEKMIVITDDPPEGNCKPSVDYLFRSVAENFPGQALSVILTGMGSDGTKGVIELRKSGCYSIAQDEESCVVFGMPKSLIKAEAADVILPLLQIANHIVQKIGRL